MVDAEREGKKGNLIVTKQNKTKQIFLSSKTNCISFIFLDKEDCRFFCFYFLHLLALTRSCSAVLLSDNYFRQLFYNSIFLDGGGRGGADP